MGRAQTPCAAAHEASDPPRLSAWNCTPRAGFVRRRLHQREVARLGRRVAVGRPTGRRLSQSHVAVGCQRPQLQRDAKPPGGRCPAPRARRVPRSPRPSWQRRESPHYRGRGSKRPASGARPQGRRGRLGTSFRSGRRRFATDSDAREPARPASRPALRRRPALPMKVRCAPRRRARSWTWPSRAPWIAVPARSCGWSRARESPAEAIFRQNLDRPLAPFPDEDPPSGATPSEPSGWIRSTRSAISSR